MPKGGRTYSFTLTLTLVLVADRWLTQRPDRFTTGNDSVPMVKEAGLSQGFDCLGSSQSVNLTRTGKFTSVILVSLWKGK